MRIYRVDINDYKKFLEKLGLSRGGVEIISDKMELFYILIKDIKTPAANILKQDALSIGAEVAVPKGVVDCSIKSCDVLLIANKAQLKRLAKKELLQPFGLKEIGRKLEELSKGKEVNRVELMGVINANSDSFYQGSRFVGEDAIKRIKELISEGADIIDIGGVSSRPGSDMIDSKEELLRVKDICDFIKKEKLFREYTFSIDSYNYEVIEYALRSGFKIINDITAARDERHFELAKEYGAKIVLMHMQGTPKDMQKNPYYEDVISEVDAFFEERIKRAFSYGLDIEDIILDVGIGFGKRLEDNLLLLKHHKHFSHFGAKLLVGASRKSMIDKIVPTPVEERLPGTLAIHLKAVENGASIIRAHDIKEHYQALKVYEAIENI